MSSKSALATKRGHSPQERRGRDGIKFLQQRKGGGCLQLLLGGILDGSVPPSQGPSSLGSRPRWEDKEREKGTGRWGWGGTVLG